MRIIDHVRSARIDHEDTDFEALCRTQNGQWPDAFIDDCRVFQREDADEQSAILADLQTARELLTGKMKKLGVTRQQYQAEQQQVRDMFSTIVGDVRLMGHNEVFEQHYQRILAKIQALDAMRVDQTSQMLDELLANVEFTESPRQESFGEGMPPDEPPIALFRRDLLPE